MIQALPSPISILDTLVEDYLMHGEARGLSPATLNGSYGYSLRAIFLPWCNEHGIREVSQLDRRAFDQFTTGLLRRTRANGKPISRWTVATYVRPVRLFLKWASTEGEDVKARPQIPRCPKPPVDVLSTAEIDRMEAAMPTERNQLIIRLLGDCGLRLDELTKLPTDCVIRSANRAYLRVHGKRDRVRDVPIPPQLLRRLLRHVAGRPANTSSSRLLLSLRRGPAGDYPALSPHGVEQVVKDAAARARITKRVYPHLMRHSWMTEMLRSGMNPLQLSVIAGASPQVIADHYAHLSKDDAFEAMMRAIAVSKKGRQ